MYCAQSCPTLCDSMDCSPPGSSEHGILHARLLEWVSTSYSRGSSWPRDQSYLPCVSWIGRWTLYHWDTWEAPKSVSCSVVSDSWLSHSPLGSSVNGILRARMLEWVAFPFSRGSSHPRDWNLVSCTAGRFFTFWASRDEGNANQLIGADKNLIRYYFILIKRTKSKAWQYWVVTRI